MSIELNHLIVPARNRRLSARFLADVLGVELQPDWAGFVPVKTGNGVILDFADAVGDIRPMHCAFLVGDREFDDAVDRMKRSGVAFFADFDGSGPGEINHLYGGRGVYFRDPDGHLFELITAPYGATPQRWRDPAPS